VLSLTHGQRKQFTKEGEEETQETKEVKMPMGGLGMLFWYTKAYGKYIYK